MVNEFKKIAIIVQRCGQQIQAGAEVYAFNLAKSLAEQGMAVEVLTSQSDDYIYWNNNLAQNEEIKTNGKSFIIKRFPVLHTRQKILFGLIKRISYILCKISKKLSQLFSPIFDYLFLKSQGPWCPALWDYLKVNEKDFDLIIVKSYLYAPNVYALNTTIHAKKVFIVTAHDEPEFTQLFVEKSIKNSDILAFVSKAEKEFCHKVWPISKSKGFVLLPPGLSNEIHNTEESIRFDIKKYEHQNYYIYIGRIDKNKNVDFIFANSPKECLVLFAGDLKYPIPNDPRFKYLGRVNEAEKEFLLKNAIALLIASRLEAYSIVTAEAIKNNCLVLALKGCGPVDELIEEYGGLSCEENEFSQKMLDLLNNKPLNLQIKSAEIVKDKSWESNANKIKHIISEQR